MAKPDTAITGLIWDIKKYALHDGPGIRSTVFFKGCLLKCQWCCNPESQSFQPEKLWIRERCVSCSLCREVCPVDVLAEIDEKFGIWKNDKCALCGQCADRCPREALQMVGKRVTVAEVLQEIAKDAVFYSRTGGGLTLSGGEPLSQPDFALELLREYKVNEYGRHASIETSGYAPWPKLAPLLEYTDLVLFDLKHIDPAKHFYLTGVSNEPILENAKRIAESSTEIIIRFPLIPGCNDSERNIGKTAEFAINLPGVNELHILPYHRLGEPKYKRLGKTYELAGTFSISQERLDTISSQLKSYGLRVKIGG